MHFGGILILVTIHLFKSICLVMIGIHLQFLTYDQ